MSEVNTLNNWWKLEDSWKTIAKTLPLVFIPFIGVGLLLLPLLLLDFFKIRMFILFFALSMVIIFVGLIPSFVILANQIGNVIKLFKIKKTLPEESKYRKIFTYYLIGFFVPIIGPIFWSKAINNIMEYLGTQTSIQNDIEYVKHKGKIYTILGTILWVMFWVFYALYYIMLLLSLRNKIIFTRAFVDFLIVFFSILGVIALIMSIIMVATQIDIINRLTNSIHNSGLY